VDETTFAIWRVDGVDVVQVRGVLDLPAAVRLRLTLFGRLDAGARHVVVDLARVRLLDAGSIAVLLRAADRLEQHSGSLVAPGATGIVLRALEIAGVAKRLRAYETLDRRLADPHADRADQPVPDPDAVHGHWGDEIHQLIGQLHHLPAGSPERAVLRDRAVEVALPFAERLARRFYGLGEPGADLNQVAALGLIRALDGYDPALGTDFASYATPTIVGELRKYFRDRGWAVRVPRRMQELRLEIRRVRAELPQQLNRTPTTRDIAERLDIAEEDIEEVVMAGSAYQPTSLQTPITRDAESQTLLDSLGAEDGGFAAVDLHESVHPLISALPEREREVLLLRFFGNMTQHEIAGRVGISQVHVSRMLARTLAGLRRQLLPHS
jgi:RNA polymerase sigma-B factor